MQLGDIVKVIMICAVVLPLIGFALMSSNLRLFQSLGKVVSGLGFVAAAAMALLIIAVVGMTVWLGFQMAR